MLCFQSFLNLINFCCGVVDSVSLRCEGEVKFKKKKLHGTAADGNICLTSANATVRFCRWISIYCQLWLISCYPVGAVRWQRSGLQIRWDRWSLIGMSMVSLKHTAFPRDVGRILLAVILLDKICWKSYTWKARFMRSPELNRKSAAPPSLHFESLIVDFVWTFHCYYLRANAIAKVWEK